MQKNIKSAFSILILLATSVVTVATSKVNDEQVKRVTPESLARKEYYVASNCPQSIQQERITVDNEYITYPMNRSFYQYGIPAYTLNLTFSNQVNSSMVGGVARTCVRSEMSVWDAELIVYTCSESGRTVCQVSFEELRQ